MGLKFNSRDPVYVQVVQHFKERIAKGELEPGGEVPSRRELANKLKINPNTAQRAYREMEEEGLIFTEGNLPSRVTKDEQILRALREELIMEATSAFITSMRSIKVPLDEMLENVKENYEKTSNNEGKGEND
ncbi:GntR family transcriptional regulator [Cerasibacillus terrae]|uniref:GntR family transcriptional regulator n=1 Tax=Cerasibacillus terrae TaxID=2498845 RepID=A0A5C8NRS8_9BACI|nr:GntR family transcriptional regulator [Cerasibacillus terrae]TXL63710.1 GntR family transcriptional regulator [Cerasibacillus terrae]